VPATPSVFPAIGGLSILWTGLDADGNPLPAGTTVQVHLSTTTGFTPEEATLRGVLSAGERLVLTDLTSGTTYFVRFVLVFPDGTIGETSAQQSLAAGFVLTTNIGTGTITADQVSFDATAIGGIQQFVGTTQPTVTGAGTANQQPKDGSTWINTTNLSYNTLTNGVWVTRQWGQAAISAGAISTGQLAAGAITANSGIIGNLAVGSAQIADGAITNAKIQDLSADKITTGTILGILFRTSGGAKRIELATSGGPFGADAVYFYDSNAISHAIFVDGGTGALSFQKPFGNANVNISGQLTVDTELQIARSVNLNSDPSERRAITMGWSGLNSRAMRIDANGDVFSVGIDSATTINAANVRVGASSQLLRSTSTERIKTDIRSLGSELPGVSPEKISDELPSVHPYDVLKVAAVEFESLADADDHQRSLGFVAENVAEVFPWAAEWDDDGQPSAVADRPIVAALLTVVKEQQETIQDLSARLDALEA
jgi:hypothetical protein